MRKGNASTAPANPTVATTSTGPAHSGQTTSPYQGTPNNNSNAKTTTTPNTDRLLHPDHPGAPRPRSMSRR